VASRLFSSPLQSLWPGAWRGLLRSSPPSLWASANASPTLESAPALPAAALPREVAAKAPPTHLFFSLEALQSGRGRRPPTKTRQAGAPNAGQKEDKDTSREKKRTKTPSTDAKAEVWSSGALLRLLPWHPTRNPARRKTRAKPLAPAPLETSATEGASTRRAEGRPHVRCASASHQRRRQPQCQRQRQPLAPAASARR
jgi:hypothetical protein